MPSYRMPGLMRVIRQPLIAKSPDGDLLLVTSELEKTVYCHLEDDPALLAILTFSQALDMLKCNGKMETVNSPSKWHPFSKGAWYKDGILPRNILVVFEIDPTVPADCALGLIFLVEWALGASSEPESNVRILTLSTDDCKFLSALVKLRAPETSVAYSDLTDSGINGLGQAVVHCSVSDKDTADKVSTAFLEDSSIPQIVVSFRGPHLATQLDQRLKSRNFSHRFIESEQDGRELTDIIERQEGDSFVWLTINPALFINPVQFCGYQKIRIVLGSPHEPSPCWDNKTHQLVSYSRQLAKEELISQLAWALQMSASQVHIYTELACIESWIESIEHSNVRRRHIENTQLEGLITAVADLSSWKFDVHCVLCCFVRYPIRIDIMMEQLRIQHVLRRGEMALGGVENDVYRAILPLVKYDHRLALFVALESDDIVRRLKVQLASIIALDMNKLIRLETPEPIGPDSTVATEILNSCKGHCHEFAHEGTVWLVHGLWSAYLTAVEDGTDDGIIWDMVIVDKSLSQSVTKLIKKMSKAMTTLGLRPVARQTVQHDNRAIDEGRKNKLQAHLLAAYIYQIAIGHQPLPDGRSDRSNSMRYRLFNLDIADTKPFSDEVTSLLNIEQLMASSGEEIVSGISTNLQRVSGDTNVLVDWTLIPLSVVAVWLVDHRPGHNIPGALMTLYRTPKVNSDELRQ
ncbi:hypothetical protein BFJ72_g2590 [Fusarium proliferatum]|uniref:Uncharacterized protein n=1 Tax=Gibberella intermedia TaxID=948311 RepID=A0A420TZA1_GIBIN|nr:hypothetical protein BFJ72_g2590 [Fusarium proliferatum]